MKWNPINWAVFKHTVTSSYCLFSIHHLHLHPCLQVTLHFKLPSPHLQLDLLSISFSSASVWKGGKKKHLRETIVGSWFSTLPNFSNLLQTATNKIKREYYSLNTHGKPIPNEKARFWQCGEDCIGNGWWNGHSLEAHISLTWQNFVSRSFPNACLVQSSMRGATLAWHQVNPLVIAGVSLLWRGSLLHSQMGFRRACQENFKIWNVTEKKVAASFNCLLSVQTVAFHIFMQRLHITQCENRVKKCGKWVCAYVFNWVQCWVPNFDQADQTGVLCESLKWWNLVAIAAN